MSKRISLSQGEFTIIDNKNYEWLSQYKWYAYWNKDTQSYYAARNGRTMNGKRIQISMAREILGLSKGDKHQADHENHNTLDNRESNLRIVTRQQNQFNQKSPKGYTWCKTVKKYQAQIKVNKRLIYLGLFDTIKEAHNAYLEAKKKYHKI